MKDTDALLTLIKQLRSESDGLAPPDEVVKSMVINLIYKRTAEILSNMIDSATLTKDHSDRYNQITSLCDQLAGVRSLLIYLTDEE